MYAKGFLCVNDSSVSRSMRLKNVLQSYVPQQLLTNDKLHITSFDGSKWGEIERNAYNRVRKSHVIVFIMIRVFIQILPLCPPSPFLSPSVFRSLLTFPVPQTDIHSWRTTTIYSVRAEPARDEGCHSYSWSCCCKSYSMALHMIL